MIFQEIAGTDWNYITLLPPVRTYCSASVHSNFCFSWFM